MEYEFHNQDPETVKIYTESILQGLGETLYDYEHFVEQNTYVQDDTYPFLGLSGETGEVLELVKKAWRENGTDWIKEVNVDRLVEELGDVLFYVTRCLWLAGSNLTDAMAMNMEKLETRNANSSRS